jgi:hypothetical protein
MTMARILKADGTVVTQTTYTSDDTDNSLGTDYTVPYDIYEETRFPNTPWSSTRRQVVLKYRAGQRITQAQLDALYAEPTATPALSPNTGGTAGGTTVTITGTNLGETTGVTFGGTAATDVVKLSETSVTCVTPAKSAGAVNVVITTPAGSVTKTNAFTYA